MRRFTKGFSLVELMIVVAIIGILAAIAIPNFIRYQLNAKRGEVNGNVDGVKTAEIKYDGERDGFIALTVQPRADTALNKAQVTWPLTDTAADPWTSVGWRPDGNIRGNIIVTIVAASAGVPEDFVVTGKSDVDDDSNLYEVTARRDVNPTITTSTVNFY
ncbi:MAG: hypothetical protein RLZZ299_2125 [Pseudomonadota bacterium]|jgi:type IV pilus assembly protein PilA